MRANFTSWVHAALLPCLSNCHFKDDEQWLFTHDAEQSVVDVRYWLRVNNFSLIKRMTLHGGGFAKLPAFLVRQEVAAGELVRVLPNHQLPSTPAYLVFPDQRPLNRPGAVQTGVLREPL